MSFRGDCKFADGCEIYKETGDCWDCEVFTPKDERCLVCGEIYCCCVKGE